MARKRPKSKKMPKKVLKTKVSVKRAVSKKSDSNAKQRCSEESEPSGDKKEDCKIPTIQPLNVRSSTRKRQATSKVASAIDTTSNTKCPKVSRVKVPIPKGKNNVAVNIKTEVVTPVISEDENWEEVREVEMKNENDSSDRVSGLEGATNSGGQNIEAKNDFPAFDGVTATIREPDVVLRFAPKEMIGDNEDLPLLKIMETHIEVPKEHMLGMCKHPLAVAVKSTAGTRRMKKNVMNEVQQINTEIVDQDYHLKGALEISWKQNGILNEQLRKKTNECEQLNTMLALERSRFISDWSERDKKRIINEAEENAREQKHYYDRQFEELVEKEKAKTEKRLKDIDRDRLKLSHENAQVLKCFESEKARRAALQTKHKQLNEKFDLMEEFITVAIKPALWIQRNCIIEVARMISESSTSKSNILGDIDSLLECIDKILQSKSMPLDFQPSNEMKDSLHEIFSCILKDKSKKFTKKGFRIFFSNLSSQSAVASSNKEPGDNGCDNNAPLMVIPDSSEDSEECTADTDAQFMVYDIEEESDGNFEDSVVEAENEDLVILESEDIPTTFEISVEMAKELPAVEPEVMDQEVEKHEMASCQQFMISTVSQQKLNSESEVEIDHNLENEKTEDIEIDHNLENEKTDEIEIDHNLEKEQADEIEIDHNLEKEKTEEKEMGLFESDGNGDAADDKSESAVDKLLSSDLAISSDEECDADIEMDDNTDQEESPKYSPTQTDVHFNVHADQFESKGTLEHDLCISDDDSSSLSSTHSPDDTNDEYYFTLDESEAMKKQAPMSIEEVQERLVAEGLIKMPDNSIVAVSKEKIHPIPPSLEIVNTKVVKVEKGRESAQTDTSTNFDNPLDINFCITKSSCITAPKDILKQEENVTLANDQADESLNGSIQESSKDDKKPFDSSSIHQGQQSVVSNQRITRSKLQASSVPLSSSTGPRKPASTTYVGKSFVKKQLSADCTKITAVGSQGKPCQKLLFEKQMLKRQTGEHLNDGSTTKKDNMRSSIQGASTLATAKSGCLSDSSDEEVKPKVEPLSHNIEPVTSNERNSKILSPDPEAGTFTHQVKSRVSHVSQKSSNIPFVKPTNEASRSSKQIPTAISHIVTAPTARASKKLQSISTRNRMASNEKLIQNRRQSRSCSNGNSDSDIPDKTLKKPKLQDKKMPETSSGIVKPSTSPIQSTPFSQQMFPGQGFNPYYPFPYYNFNQYGYPQHPMFGMPPCPEQNPSSEKSNTSAGSTPVNANFPQFGYPPHHMFGVPQGPELNSNSEKSKGSSVPTRMNTSTFGDQQMPLHPGNMWQFGFPPGPFGQFPVPPYVPGSQQFGGMIPSTPPFGGFSASTHGGCMNPSPFEPPQGNQNSQSAETVDVLTKKTNSGTAVDLLYKGDEKITINKGPVKKRKPLSKLAKIRKNADKCRSRSSIGLSNLVQAESAKYQLGKKQTQRSLSPSAKNLNMPQKDFLKNKDKEEPVSSVSSKSDSDNFTEKHSSKNSATLSMMKSATQIQTEKKFLPSSKRVVKIEKTNVKDEPISPVLSGSESVTDLSTQAFDRDQTKDENSDNSMGPTTESENESDVKRDSPMSPCPLSPQASTSNNGASRSFVETNKRVVGIRNQENSFTFSEVDWTVLNGSGGRIILTLSKDILDDLLRASEDDLNNFESVILRYNLGTRFKQVPDIGLARQIYHTIFEDAKEQKPGNPLTEVQRKLQIIVESLSEEAPELYGNLAERTLGYFLTQVIPIQTYNFLNDITVLENLSRFYGVVCSIIDKKNGSLVGRKLIFESMYRRPPHAFAIAHGVWRVHSSTFFYLPFDQLDLKDRAMNFIVLRPPRFNDAVMWVRLSKLLKDAFGVTVPDMTYDEFVTSVINEIRDYESAKRLEEASQTLTMLLLFGGITWTIKFLETALPNLTKDWREATVTDGVYAAILQSIGRFCKDTVEPHDFTKLRKLFDALAKVANKTPVLAEAIEECRKNIDAKMKVLNQKKNKKNLHWEWRYTKRDQPQRKRKPKPRVDVDVDEKRKKANVFKKKTRSPRGFRKHV